MAEFFDYNADRGTWYEADFRDDGSFTIHTRQDVQPVVDAATRARNSGWYDKPLGDFFFQKYATIPAHVELELRQKGINIYNKHQTKDVLKAINRDYPYLKTTNRTHE